MTQKKSSSAPQAGGKPVKSYQLKPWKIAAISFSALLVVAGLLLAFVGSDKPESSGTGVEAVQPGGSSGLDSPVKGFGGGSTSGPIIEGSFKIGTEEEESGTWSPALLRGGISFFVAFCLAFALRSFLRLATIFIGIWALSLFAFDYLDWIQVNWGLIEDKFTNLTTNL